MELVAKARQLAVNKDKDHPWKDMTDMELLKSAGLYEEDMITGNKGFNLAAILLFGKPETIQSCAPGYKTDAIYRVENMDRYDDRLIVEENLIKSYDLLMEFISKHTNDKYFLIDNVNMSVRSAIAREIVSNLLVHREFGSAFPAKLVIEKDRIFTENWNRAQRVGKIELNEFTPYPKNPLLAKFFVNIGYADALGSGVRNLYKFTKIYSGGEPDFEEGDVFRLTVPLQSDNDNQNNNCLTERQNTILAMIQADTSIQVEDIADSLAVSRSTVLREVQEIKKQVGIVYIKKIKQWQVPK